MRFDLDVAYPSVRLPFAATGFVLDWKVKRAAIWSGPAGIPQASPDSTTAVRLAIVALDSGDIVAQRKLPDAIKRVALSDRHRQERIRSLEQRVETLTQLLNKAVRNEDESPAKRP